MSTREDLSKMFADSIWRTMLLPVGSGVISIAKLHKAYCLAKGKKHLELVKPSTIDDNELDEDKIPTDPSSFNTD